MLQADLDKLNELYLFDPHGRLSNQQKGQIALHEAAVKAVETTTMDEGLREILETILHLIRIDH